MDGVQRVFRGGFQRVGDLETTGDSGKTRVLSAVSGDSGHRERGDAAAPLVPARPTADRPTARTSALRTTGLAPCERPADGGEHRTRGRYQKRPRGRKRSSHAGFDRRESRDVQRSWCRASTPTGVTNTPWRGPSLGRYREVYIPAYGPRRRQRHSQSSLTDNIEVYIWGAPER
jgi:hypothetical protein